MTPKRPDPALQSSDLVAREPFRWERPRELWLPERRSFRNQAAREIAVNATPDPVVSASSAPSPFQPPPRDDDRLQKPGTRTHCTSVTVHRELIRRADTRHALRQCSPQLLPICVVAESPSADNHTGDSSTRPDDPGFSRKNAAQPSGFFRKRSATAASLSVRAGSDGARRVTSIVCDVLALGSAEPSGSSAGPSSASLSHNTRRCARSRPLNNESSATRCTAYVVVSSASRLTWVASMSPRAPGSGHRQRDRQGHARRAARADVHRPNGE